MFIERNSVWWPGQWPQAWAHRPWCSAASGLRPKAVAPREACGWQCQPQSAAQLPHCLEEGHQPMVTSCCGHMGGCQTPGGNSGETHHRESLPGPKALRPPATPAQSQGQSRGLGGLGTGATRHPCPLGVFLYFSPAFCLPVLGTSNGPSGPPQIFRAAGETSVPVTLDSVPWRLAGNWK